MSRLLEMLTNFAAPCTPTPGAGGRFLDFPTWYKYLPGDDVGGKCRPVMIFPNDLSKILLAFVEIGLRAAALIAVGYVIYGGFRYILSTGEPESTKNARNTIRNAIIGLAISMLGTAVVTFVGRSLIK